MARPVKVSVYRGPEHVFEETFERDLLKIGRLASAHVKLDEPSVARIHAVLEASGGGYNLIDMGSPEGTRVNDQKVSRVKIEDGDVVTVGPYRIELHWASFAMPEAARATSAPSPWAAGLSSAPPASPASTTAHTGSLSPSPPAQTGSFSAPSPAQTGSFSPPSPAQTDSFSPPAPAQTDSFPPPSPALSDTGASPAESPPNSGFGSPSSGFGSPSSGFGSPSVPAEAPASGGRALELRDVSGPPVEAEAPPTSGFPGAPPPAPSDSASTADMAPAVSPVPPTSSTSTAPFPPAARHDAGVAVPHVDHAWGSVPSNLASVKVLPTHRALEIKTLWKSDVVLDSLTVFDEKTVTLGDERKVTGWGPFQKVQRCDVEVPTRGLPAASFVFAESMSDKAAEYRLHIPRSAAGRVEKFDGPVLPLESVLHPDADPAFGTYELQPEETVYVDLGELAVQVRYVRRTSLPPVPLAERISYEYANTFILVLFLHVVAVASFLAMPQTTDNLEEVYQAVNRFTQTRLSPEQRKKQQALLSKLKSGEKAAKAAGKQGKAGRKDAKPKNPGRRANKGKPDDKELATQALTKLFGGRAGAVGAVMGGTGMGGELKSALGGVTGARVGDASGFGGLGLRGSGPGGGGKSYTSYGIGGLGTKGRGGGGTGDYGVGAGQLDEKKDRGVTITTERVRIEGSLPKEVIRRVIKQHLAQIRYCYEKELSRSPGIFGKVATQFIISGKGTVTMAKVDQTTLNNAAVEQCICQKIRTWKFPKPKGGGIVVVKYPFVLKQSG